MGTDPKQWTEDDWLDLGFKASNVFSPATPIDKRQLFAGRTSQLRKVIDAINQSGQHVVIYGERGVGKTSLSNVLSEFLNSEYVIAPRVNADSEDKFSSLWLKVFNLINLTANTQEPGFTGEVVQQQQRIADALPKDLTTDIVRDKLALVGRQADLIVIIDEFDRIRSTKVTKLCADTIKLLSDYNVPATLILVGVANSVDELISGHQSIERTLVQVRMPRMSLDELEAIINTGLSALRMTIDQDARDRIVTISQGLPHYTHLLSLNAVRQAIDSKALNVSLQNVNAAIVKALDDTQHSIQSIYHKATMSPRKESLFKQVLLACSLAKTDDLGFFKAADIRDPMSTIMGRRYDIPAFSTHLKQFCENDRGPVLERTGTSHRYRFRFKNPLLQPYVLMKGLSDGSIDGAILDQYRT